MAHRSRFIGAGAIVLAIGMLIALPTFSSGATVKNDLRSFAAPSPRVTLGHPADPAAAARDQPARAGHRCGHRPDAERGAPLQRRCGRQRRRRGHHRRPLARRAARRRHLPRPHHRRVGSSATRSSAATPCRGRRSDEANNLESIGDPSSTCSAPTRASASAVVRGLLRDDEHGLVRTASASREPRSAAPTGLPAPAHRRPPSRPETSSSDGTCQTSNGGSRVADVQRRRRGGRSRANPPASRAPAPTPRRRRRTPRA